MSMSKVACEKLLERAHLMGMDAGRDSTPTPMIVGSPSTPFGSDIDYRGKFVSYLKSLGMGYKHYYGGYYVPVREFGQSLARKEAYAEAYAKVLSEEGMSCYVDSRMD